MLKTNHLQRKWSSVLLVGFLSLLCFVTLSTPLHAKRPKYQKRLFTSIVLDAKNMRVLSKHRADVQVHPASLTKMMTLYLLFEDMEKGRISPHDSFRISRYAANRPPSKLGLRAGTSISIKDAVYAIVAKSANDVTSAVAEGLGKTEEKFVQRMNATARRLGMKRTQFKNASGLPHPAQLSTAKDMATLGHALFTHFPDYKPYFRTQHFSYQGTTYPNTNKLLGRIHGVNGIKTGYTAASGFNLVASAERGNQWVIAVAMGCPSGRQRNNQTAQLLEANFSKMKHGYTGQRISPLPAFIPPSSTSKTLQPIFAGQKLLQANRSIRKGKRQIPLPSPLPPFKLTHPEGPQAMTPSREEKPFAQETTTAAPIHFKMATRALAPYVDPDDVTDDPVTKLLQARYSEANTAVSNDNNTPPAAATEALGQLEQIEAPLVINGDDPVTRITLTQEYGLSFAPQQQEKAAAKLLKKAVDNLRMTGIIDQRILRKKHKKTYRYTPLLLGITPSELPFARATLRRQGMTVSILQPRKG